MNPDRPEELWRRVFNHLRFVAGGALVSTALAALDTAVWDLRARAAGLPLWKLAGGAQDSVPAYQTEGGWLQLSTEELIENARAAQAAGFHGFKMKVGRRATEDAERLAAVREAVGPHFDVMLDANQAFTLDEALRRGELYAPFSPRWYEEPMPAENVAAHAELARASRIPIALGETLFLLGHVREYLEHRAVSILQMDAGRIGGITPWLKAAHMAEASDVAVSPHFLMELHVQLAAAVPNAAWVEHIPQLQKVATSRVELKDGRAHPSQDPGLGIAWDEDALARFEVPDSRCEIR
jgi:L-alanine-DL-glutamate epimerase-like enolase superfamily enzyme